MQSGMRPGDVAALNTPTPMAVVTGHFDGDAFIDIAVASASTHTVHIIFGDGLGGAKGAVDVPLQAPQIPVALGVGRFSAHSDSVDDIVAMVAFDAGTPIDPRMMPLPVHMPNPVVGAPRVFVQPATSDDASVAVGDIDGDGKVDLVAGAIANSPSRFDRMYNVDSTPQTQAFGRGFVVYKGLGDGRFDQRFSEFIGPTNYIALPGPRGHYIAAGSNSGGIIYSTVDGIPRPPILQTFDVGTVTAVAVARGFGLKTYGVAYAALADGTEAFNGSGLKIFFIDAPMDANGNSPAPHLVTLLAPPTPVQHGPTPVGVSAIALGDFDGDKRTDVAATEWENGRLHVFSNAGIGPDGLVKFSDHVTELGSSAHPEHVAVGDLNRDGLDDLVIALHGTGAVRTILGAKGTR
jgi:hypothetical protein